MSVGVIKVCDEKCGAPWEHDASHELMTGPSWSLALREGRRLRDRAAERLLRPESIRVVEARFAVGGERENGIPPGWIGLP